MESSDFFIIVACDPGKCVGGKKVVRKVFWNMEIGKEDDEMNNKPLTRLNSCKPIKMSIVDSEGENQTLTNIEGQSGILD